MATITLIQAAAHTADHIHLMTAQPMNVDLTGLQGGAVQFRCTNAFAAIKGAKQVQITYDAGVGSHHQNIAVSSVLP
ncbi:hypothetical protein FK220_011540 [Flavobacteriaceae bacterium TP-CH-4]|uniref:Uncharacterized protein n=1 Tax=Pelagihabitans pacificus TaxID=2696054 RepID=A0A967ATF5_9FLAO|nr:hypothetical protein [Pelagihabitans pacificus]NHF59978.1 hypothetical protein [Pelagihabitans pacificus]